MKIHIKQGAEWALTVAKQAATLAAAKVLCDIFLLAAVKGWSILTTYGVGTC